MLLNSNVDVFAKSNVKSASGIPDNVDAIRHRELLEIWLRGRDLNPRPSGYEPDELPGCSTPHFDNNFDIDVVQIEKAFVRRQRGEIAILFAFAAVCDFVDA